MQTKINKKNTFIQFIEFCVVGVANTAIDWIVYFLLTKFILINFKLWPTAKAVSFLVAVINSYILNTLWTFKQEYSENLSSRESKTKIFAKFFVVSLVGWGINYFVFKYFIESFNFGSIVILGKTISTQSLYPLIAASLAAILWNFVANKLWTFQISDKK